MFQKTSTMPMTTRPIRSTWQHRLAFERIRFRLARRFGLDVNLLNAAASVEELHPTEKIAGAPCIALPGQFERISKGGFDIDIAEEIAQLKGGPREIGPTVRYVLDNVLVSHGIIHARGRRKLFNSTIDLGSVQSPWAEYDEAGLRSSYVGCYFFGHWLADDCTTHLLAQQSGTPMSMPTPPWPNCAGYLGLFGQSYIELGRAHVRRLVLYDDIAHNEHKASRFRALRARVGSNNESRAAGRIVYLMRGRLGGAQPVGTDAYRSSFGRTIHNEAEIVEALMRQGVTIVCAETLTVPQLIAELLGARIVIGLEGSQLSHGLFTLHDKGGMLAIQPPDRLYNGYMDAMNVLGMRYGIVVGEQRQSGFHLPLGDLLRTIDLMDTKLC
ncbi:glycosyltransferase 61 family protein [Bradyrhizobium erythrophlei]|nr:glycosyltransferase family 61 protein [Bradyrhizobium erythrophlei]